MVLPIHDVNPHRRTPYVTYALIAVNVVVFLLSPLAATLTGSGSAAAQCRQLAYLDHHAAKPDEVIGNDQPTAVATGQVGVDPAGRVGCVEQSPPPYEKNAALSVLTAMFMHGGWLHLLGNLLFLYVFGDNVEDRLGRLRYLGFYLLCGFAATYGFSALDPSSTAPLVGASGAIAGVLGGYLVLFPKARVWSLLTFFFFLPVRLPAWLVLGSWFLLQALYSAGAGITDATGGGVAYVAHAVGFVVGALLVLPLRGSGRDRRIADPRFGPYARRPL
ncbi:MAG TPA: rhomboid family intramembrane serine protease [Mycobacteriales bacterium]|nr:rhomboid family intramembrane serine protease [Mycobacteriales bacterium]